MAALCDVFVMDAFGTAHRAEASTHGVAASRRWPAPARCWRPSWTRWQGAGHPARPLLAIVAGSKVSTKLTAVETLVGKVDQLIVGGGIANTFIAAPAMASASRWHEADLVDDGAADHRRGQGARRGHPAAARRGGRARSSPPTRPAETSRHRRTSPPTT
jgi:phosphoglycerate kinase